MKPEQWQQIERLYHAALEQKPDKRAAYVAEVCADDANLRHEVEALLQYDDESSNFLNANAAAALAQQLDTDDLQDTQTLPLGQKLGAYQILAPLGRGGMGEVYLALDTRLQRKVALKLLPTRYTSDAARVRRFEHEARAASALNHPNILTIYDIGEHEQLHYIVTEYVEGETLRKQLLGAMPIALSTKADCFVQIAKALSAAHEAGIIHRDIKPENVMVRRDGLVKVLDFGLAKLTEEYSGADTDSVAPSTASGIVMGTPRYMSPEQARGEKVDVRSDIFSFGVLLYEMIAGREPFQGATPSDVIAAILRDDPLPLSQLSDCPAALEQLVSHCLAKEPEQRFQTAEELVTELTAAQSVLEKGNVSTDPTWQAKTISAQHPTTRLRLRPRRWLVIAGVLAMLALLVLLVMQYYPRRTPLVTASTIKTLAVLPPRPMTSADKDEAMELGAMSMLITKLSSLRQLIVRSENAVIRYAQPDQDPLAAGREQKVEAVLHSRYQRSGERVRFMLRLLRVSDGEILWADTLDQQVADLFAIQDALSVKVTGALRLTLSSTEKAQLAKRYTNSAEAWRLYVRGRTLMHTDNHPEILSAINNFEEAIKLDPDFALAHTNLGKTYFMLSFNGSTPAKEVMPKGRVHIDQALRLDDQLAEAHAHLAEYKIYYEWDFEGGRQELQRGLELDPNSADVHHAYAFYLSMVERQHDQAIAEIRKAEELDPTDLLIGMNVANILHGAGRDKEAREQSRIVVKLQPNAAMAYSLSLGIAESEGDEQGFLAANLKLAELGGASPDEIARFKEAFAQGGFKGYWRWELTRTLEEEKRGYTDSRYLAILYLKLGEKDKALARIEKMVEDRKFHAVGIKSDRAWDDIRDDPRFIALVNRVGLP